MTDPRWLPTRLMTPDEVLDGIRDLIARATGEPWAEVAKAVGFDTPLKDFAARAGEGFDPGVIELYFETDDLPDEWWQKVEEFGTLRGLCFALAQFVEVPVIEPVVVLGKPSVRAGAFVTVRQLLANAGADVTDLRPSSPLLPYVWLWPDVFRWQLPRLAPGRVPEVVFLNFRLLRRVLGIMLGLFGVFAGLAVRKQFPVLGGLIVAVFVKVIVFDLLLAPWAARRRNWQVRFGDLYDFRDLVGVLVPAGDLPETKAPGRLALGVLG